MALPRRTLDYLQRGASEGMRNAELFDATCQFRDAGHPLEETEGQLLARALADGLTEAEARHDDPLGLCADVQGTARRVRAIACRATTPRHAGAVTSSGPPRAIHDGAAGHHRRRLC